MFHLFFFFFFSLSSLTFFRFIFRFHLLPSSLLHIKCCTNQHIHPADESFGFSFGSAEDVFLQVNPRTPGGSSSSSNYDGMATPVGVEHLQVPRSVSKAMRSTPNFAFTPGAHHTAMTPADQSRLAPANVADLESASRHLGGGRHAVMSAHRSGGQIPSSSKKRKRGRSMLLGNGSTPRENARNGADDCFFIFLFLLFFSFDLVSFLFFFES